VKKRTFLCGALAAGISRPAPALPRLLYGGDAAFPPFESLDAQGRPRGFQIELLAELGREMGVEFVPTLRPWPQTEADFRQGRLDVVAMVDTHQRRDWARFTRGHATPAFAVYRRLGQAEAHGLKDLAGLRLAVLDGEVMQDTLQHWLPSVPGPFVRSRDAGQALAAVQQGQADAALLPRAYADRALASGAWPAVTDGRLSFGLQTYALAVAPGRQDLQARLQQGLDALETSGRLEALRTRWLSSHRDLAARELAEQGLAQQRTRTWGLAGASSVALALLGIGLWRRGRRIAAETQRRRQAEDALRHAQELLERSFGHNPEAMLIVDRDSGVVRDANAAMLALLGVPAERLIDQALPSLGQHVDAQALQQLVQSLDREGALDAVPLRLRRADGRRCDCLVSADRLRVGDAVQVFCLLHDITQQLEHDAALRADYDELAEQLAQVRRELDAARQAQSRAEGSLHDFTRAVSHDLRTPLNAVQGMSGLLRRRLLTGHVQEAIGFAEHIERAAVRMSAMIDALARLAQVSRQPLQRQRVDMHQLAQQTWDMLSLAQPGLHAEFRHGELPWVEADPDLVAQVWQNLLGNAAKYSAQVAQPKVSVDSFRDERGTWYRITDNGAGFDMAQARLLFQPFQRMHSGKQFEGTGVGLSLVRRIVEHHGGEVRLRSAPGVGTVAEFTLDPLAAAR
jgi:PAS domain S-box-containing protein